MIGVTYDRYSPSELRRMTHAGSLCGVSSIEQTLSEYRSLSPDQAWWLTLLRGELPATHTTGELHYIDLFSSVGGLSLSARYAAEAVGLQSVAVAAVDLDEHALQVHRSNFATRNLLHGSVTSMVDYHVYERGANAALAYEPEITESTLATLTGKVDLVLAGPPCQGHSNLNNHTRRSDPRNQLYVTAAAAAIGLKPKMIVFENVPDIERDRMNVTDTAETILAQAGYLVSRGVVVASDFGAPQTRRRHFMIATRMPHVPLEEASGLLKRDPMNLWEAIGDLEESEPVDFMHEVPSLSRENQSRIDYLFDQDLYDLPDAQRPNCHKDGHTYPSVYGRLHWDRPSPTITTGFTTPGRGRYIHPSQRRVLTAREAARLQGFPDSFNFSPDNAAPSRKLLSKWIGDAVPLQMGFAAVLTALSGFHLGT